MTHATEARHCHRRAAIEYAKAQRFKHQMGWLIAIFAASFLAGLAL